jgi:hypothetical protein
MKNILYRLLLLPLLLAAWGAQAQAPAWLNVYGVPTTSSVFGTATNAAGDIFVTGNFSGSATFGSTTLTSAGEDDIFVAKWNSTSNTWAWAVRGGGSAADQGNGIAVNGTNVYVTGYFNSNGGATFGNFGTTFNGTGGQEIFLAKFVDGGTSVTTTSVVNAGGGGSDQGRAVAVNGSNVYITGYVTGAASFGGVALAPVYTTFDAYVAKYVDSGTLTYNSALRAGGSNIDRGNSIAVNGTNIYVAGDFRSLTAAFGSTTITNSNTDSNNLSYDAFVAKFTDSGTLAHATAVKAGGNNAGSNSPLDFANGIAVNGTSIYLTGAFSSSSVSFGNGVTLTNSDNTNANSDMYLAKYTDSGTLTAVAATKSSNSSVDVGSAVAVTGSTVYVAGNLVGSTTYGSSTVTSNGGQDLFVAKFTDAGSSFTPVGAITGGGTGDENANGLAISGTQVIAGGFLNPSQSATFATNSGTTTIPAGNGGFIARVGLAVTPPTVTTAAATSIVATSAVLGGNVTADGGGDVTDRGVVYSTTNQTPAIGGTGVTQNANGTGTGTFSETSTGLTASTTYYVRAYATNSAGTSYGAVISFTTPAASVTVVSVTRLNPSPTATTQVRYQVVFSGSVTGLSISNFSITTTGITGASISSVSGSGTTYTVTMNTGTGDGTLRLNVANATGLSPTITNVPYTAGEVYTITKNFAANPQLTIQGTGGTGSDVTAFVDAVQVLSGGTAVVNALQNGSFETHAPLANGDFGYQPTGAGWTFNISSGIAEAGSAFTPTTPIPNGIAVAFVQSNGGNNGQLQQGLTVPTGSYQVNFQAAQRICCTTLDQSLNVFINGVFVGNIQPGANGYTAFTSATFAVTAPALTASISSTAGASGSTTATSPIPFAVTFSQSVTGFTASDVVVAGGTASGFSGSGTTYTFNVTPSASGTVTVNVPANSAVDANNTGNTAATQYSLIYAQPVTATPVVTTPANGSFATTTTPTYQGTAPASSLVTVYVDGTSIGTTTTSSSGTFSLAQPTSLVQGQHTVYATAQASGSAVSANSTTNTFIVDSGRPSVAISSSTAANNGTSGTTPFAYTVTFSEAVTGFVAGDLSVVGGTVLGFSGSGTTYTFNVRPSTSSSTVTVNIAANVAQDAAGNGNTAASQYSLTFVAPTITVAPASLPNGTQGTAYSATVSASGGSAPYTYAITAGALPAGLSLTNGTLAGTPTASGSFTFTVTATDASAAPGPYSGSRTYTFTINTQPVTAAPVITTPANGSVTNQAVTISGTAPANSAVTVYVSQNGGAFQEIDTYTATAGGIFTTPAFPFPSASYQTYATAQSPGAAVSANSNTNTFTVDQTAPTVAISSTTATSGSSTTTSPFAFTVTFSESVTGFVPGDLTVSNGTVSSFSGSGTTYTFTVTPTTANTATTVNVPANVAQDQASNFNIAAAAAYALTFLAPTVTVGPAALPNGTQATAYSQTLTASGGTAPYTFAITAGALPAGLTLTSAGVLSGMPTASGSFTFTVTATDASAAPGPFSGSRSYSLTIAAPTTVTWNGSVSTDWFTAANWTPNTVPTASTSATIPSAPSGGRFPAITTATLPANVRNLSLNSGATLTQTAGTLALAGTLTNNGTLQLTGGTVSLGGTALSNIVGSSTTRFWNLTVGANGALLATSAGASMQRVLTLSGPFSTNGNSFTLESNAGSTAMVVNNGSNVISGNVTVQRYISGDLNANLGYRHFSSPISTGTVASLATSAFTPVVNPAYNTLPVPGQARPFPTVFGYDQSRIATVTNSLPSFDKGWFSPSALTDALTVGQGYSVNLPGNQTFSQTGPQNNGNVVLNLARNSGPTAAESGLALVGNPYPSPLNWQQVAEADRPGLDGVIYTFTSNDPSNPYAGSYGFYNNNIGTISPVLPLGQGFFVRVTQGQTNATLTLKNSHRPTAYANTTYQRTTAETRPLVHLTLKGTGNTLSDDAFVYFEKGSSESFDPQYDALKIPNTNGLNLSTSVTGQQFSIDGRPELGSVQRVVPLAVGVPAPGSYALATAELLNLATTPVYLRDVQLGTLTDLRLTPSYQFTVTNSSALITGRFELVFSPQQALATTPAALAQQVALYPNPAKKAAFVELPASLGRQAVTAALVDALGRQVRTITLPAQGALAHQLDLSELATGVYALRLSTSAGVVVKKLVIE